MKNQTNLARFIIFAYFFIAFAFFLSGILSLEHALSHVGLENNFGSLVFGGVFHFSITEATEENLLKFSVISVRSVVRWVLPHLIPKSHNFLTDNGKMLIVFTTVIFGLGWWFENFTENLAISKGWNINTIIVPFNLLLVILLVFKLLFTMDSFLHSITQTSGLTDF